MYFIYIVVYSLTITLNELTNFQLLVSGSKQGKEGHEPSTFLDVHRQWFPQTSIWLVWENQDFEQRGLHPMCNGYHGIPFEKCLPGLHCHSSVSVSLTN